ncbi:twin-arginine translocase TatA/TatE family subunit [Pontiella sp.]|uniref:twin-arginine translocase TatA/TatE family subunit n=1 Tax=Pontiella sp. TaxID=2837462 RepID=UPI003564307C
MNTLAIGMPGGSEIIIILVIILLLFGAKKLPELSRSLGRSLGEFKKGKEDLERELREVQDDLHQVATEPEPSAGKPPVAKAGSKDEKPTKTEPV